VPSDRPPDTCVIFNPSAGRGRARKLIAATRAWAGPDADFRATREPGHGAELAEQAAREGFARVIAAGGDGTVHEVANGLLRADKPGVRFGVWPIGSSNDYAAALNIATWWERRGRGITLTPKPVDVGRVFSGTRSLFFVNCLGIGFNGMVALESRGIRSLRGLPLYASAFVKAMLWHYTAPPLTIRYDDTELTLPTLAATVNVGVREGGFPVTPDAALDDGQFDYLHVSDAKRWQLARYLPALIAGTLPKDHPKIRMGRCTRASVRGDTPLCVHADGEFFCLPADGVTGLEIELLPKKLLVEMG
jgi:diacylglycerol kinase family enzyme